MSNSRILSKFNKSILSDGRIANTALGPGSIIQVISNKSSNQVSTTSGSWSNTGLYASITPKSTSSKILITANGLCGGQSGSTYIGLFRDSTYLDIYERHQADYSWEYSSYHFGLECLDTPNTTSQINYHLAFATAGVVGYLNRNVGEHGRGWSSITLTEISQ